MSNPVPVVLRFMLYPLERSKHQSGSHYSAMH
jgi:hypothetical protein